MIGQKMIYGDFIISPSRSFIQQTDEDRIEMRLEEIFGIDDSSDREHEEPTSAVQANETLIEILSPKHTDCAMKKKRPATSIEQQDTMFDKFQEDYFTNDPLQQEVTSEHNIESMWPDTGLDNI